MLFFAVHFHPFVGTKTKFGFWTNRPIVSSYPPTRVWRSTGFKGQMKVDTDARQPTAKVTVISLSLVFLSMVRDEKV